MIDYTLVRSKRRTIAIHILPDGRVEVRAPLRCPASAVTGFVAQKERWITEKRQAVLAQPPQRQSFSFYIGDTFPFQRREIPLAAFPGNTLSFVGTAFRLPAAWFDEGSGEDNAGRIAAVIELYKRLTLPLVTERTAHYAKALGVAPSAVRVTGARQRWGSCSGKNSLNFSWMLAAADPLALDYVVVHELCHIREHNHSAAFWKLVESILPDYKQRQPLLRETEKRLKEWDNV